MTTTRNPPDAALMRRRALWGANVRNARQKKGVSQIMLSDLTKSADAGWTQQTISAIECGTASPSDELKVAIAEALKMSAGDLFPLD